MDRDGDGDREWGWGQRERNRNRERGWGQPGPALSDSGPRCVPEPPVLAGEEKRIREFYQSRGLDRVTQPSDTVGGDPMGLPYSTFDHSRAHYFRYDEHVSLCLEKLSSSKDKSKAVLQVSGGPCSPHP
uniref:Uncharacterized protein n=1 Tax=Ficedula albicollis TaxID=59894 RepID=A0A803VUD7_FICAL